MNTPNNCEFGRAAATVESLNVNSSMLPSIPPVRAPTMNTGTGGSPIAFLEAAPSPPKNDGAEIAKEYFLNDLEIWLQFQRTEIITPPISPKHHTSIVHGSFQHLLEASQYLYYQLLDQQQSPPEESKIITLSESEVSTETPNSSNSIKADTSIKTEEICKILLSIRNCCYPKEAQNEIINQQPQSPSSKSPRSIQRSSPYRRMTPRRNRQFAPTDLAPIFSQAEKLNDDPQFDNPNEDECSLFQRQSKRLKSVKKLYRKADYYYYYEH